MGDDDAPGGLGPAAIFTQTAVGADGANDAVGGGFDGLGAFHDEFEGVAVPGSTFFEEAEGPSVPVDRAAAAEAIFVGQEGWTLPVHETLLDRLAIRVVANAAAGGVVAEACLSFAALPTRTNKFPTVRTIREGWGTSKNYFPLGSWDRDRNGKLGTGFLEVLKFVGRCEAGIVDHGVCLARLRIGRWRLFEGGLFARVRGGDLLCLI